MKFITEKIFNGLMILSTLIVFAFFGSIIWTVVQKGFPSLTWEMVSQLPGGGFYLGKEGGILNAIVGSLYIVAGATLLGLLISLPVVFYINVYLKKDSKWGYFTRLTFDVLFGIPSIVYGAFAFTIMIFFGLKTSLLGGIIVITLLIIPIFIRSMDEVAKSLPKDLLDATYSLGATKLETAKVVLRQIAP
ncbi:MAG: ABC transporter permease subunit, partial [Tannerella sp.]|nr:ABC transporter permease subunit [Tannerella sp.]